MGVFGFFAGGCYGVESHEGVEASGCACHHAGEAEGEETTFAGLGDGVGDAFFGDFPIVDVSLKDNIFLNDGRLIRTSAISFCKICSNINIETFLWQKSEMVRFHRKKFRNY